jgi:hypothetical protein
MCAALVPLVEFEPCRWADPAYDQFIGTDEWAAVWKTALNRVGIEPFTPGSWHVRAAQLAGSSVLQRVVEQALDGSGIVGFPDDEGEEDEDGERLLALNGGYALVDADGNVLFEPGCCCDLSDLASWQEAATHDGDDPYRLTIGHGVYSVSRSARDFLISIAPERVGGEVTTFRVTHDEFRLALREASAIREELRQSILRVLRDLLNDDRRAVTMSRILVGG